MTIVHPAIATISAVLLVLQFTLPPSCALFQEAVSDVLCSTKQPNPPCATNTTVKPGSPISRHASALCADLVQCIQSSLAMCLLLCTFLRGASAFFGVLLPFLLCALMRPTLGRKCVGADRSRCCDCHSGVLLCMTGSHTHCLLLTRWRPLVVLSVSTHKTLHAIPATGISQPVLSLPVTVLGCGRVAAAFTRCQGVVA
jgi:hypothetical protein